MRGALFLLLHLGVESGLVESHAILFENQLGKVEGESVGVIQDESLLAGDFGLAILTGCGDCLLKHRDAVVEGAEERILLLLGHLYYEVALLGDFRIGPAHQLDEGVDQAIQECLLLVEERVGVTDGPAQDAPDDISGLGVGGELAVGDGERDCADMVGNHAHRDVNLGVFAIFLSGELGDF